MNLKTAKITLLKKEQVSGDTKIDIIEKLGTKCAVTDFAIALGAYVLNSYHADYDNSLKGRASYYYLSANDIYSYFNSVNPWGTIDHAPIEPRACGVRPVILFNHISHMFSDLVKESSGVFEIEYGEYPQYVVSTDIEKILEKAYLSGTIRKTIKTYTTDSREDTNCFSPFEATKYEEYEYNGKKYIRMNYRNTDSYTLSNGKQYEYGDIVWIEVSPLIWYVDFETKILLSKNIIASGIRLFDSTKRFETFKETEMYEFLNTYFKKDIIPSIIKTSLLSRIFNKKNNLEKIESIELRNDIEKLMEDIEYKLNVLSERNKNDYLKYKNQYNELLNQQGNVLKLQDLNFYILAKLLADIETSIEFSKKSPVNIINHLEELKQEYINNIMNNNLEKTKVTVDELDELMKSFLLEKDEYDILTQREIIREISILYLFELKENIDLIDINKIKNSYIDSSIKSIISSISELENDGLIKLNNSFDIEDLSLENLLNIIKDIEFNKEKVIKKHKSKCDLK